MVFSMGRGESRDLRSDGGTDRADIAAAVERLDPKARKQLSWGSPLKKCLSALGAIEAEIVAIAPATLQRVNQFDGAGLGDVVQAGRPRLLVLTVESFWVVETRRATGGGGVSGREIKLARIQDGVRINEHRRKSEFGRKTRLFSFDHLRGSTLETEAFDLKSDVLLHDFASRFNAQLETCRAALVREEEGRGRDLAVAAAQAVGGAPTSMADELAKLGDLLERGLLTEEEFASEKQRLLADRSRAGD